MITDIAREVIEKEKQARTGRLDLGRCGLTEIPLEVWTEMPWLEWLSLSGSWWDWEQEQLVYSPNSGESNILSNWPPTQPQMPGLRVLIIAGESRKGWPLADLSPVAQLKQLHTLDCSGTQVADLTPLSQLKQLQTLRCSGTQVADLTPLAQLTRLQTLHCSRTKVADLEPLAQLTRLQTLNCSDTQVADLKPLAQLTRLQTLLCSGTQVADLTPLAQLTQLQNLHCSRTRVDKLEPLDKLTQLQTLRCWDTQVADLEPLAQLMQLQSLYCSETQVANLEPLAQLMQLHTLDCSHTQVTDLEPLAQLIHLQRLYCSGIKVDNLEPLAQLMQLQNLHCGNTQVANLEPILPLIKEKIVRITMGQFVPGFNFHGCPLTEPPTEIVAEGREAVLKYFEDRERFGEAPLNEGRLLILGEGGVGKTSLMRRLYQPRKKLPQGKDFTPGIDILRKRLKVRKQDFHLNVWDFGGQAIYMSLHRFFLSSSAIYVLVGATRHDSGDIHDHRFKYWLDMLRRAAGESPVFVFENVKDGVDNEMDMGSIRRSFKLNLKGKFRGDLEQDRQCVAGLRQAITKACAELVDKTGKVGKNWVSHRNRLAELAETEKVIEVSQLPKKLEQFKGESLDDLRALMRIFHSFGALLYYPESLRLKGIIFTDPMWVTAGIYRFLNDPAIKRARGKFNGDDLERVLKGSEYERLELKMVDLMEAFELCYQLPSARETWVIPGLFQAENPRDEIFGQSELELVFEFGFLPRGVLHRLMVRKHERLEVEGSWVNGGFFRDGEGWLMAYIPFASSPNRIRLIAGGAGCRMLMHAIAKEILLVAEGFPGLRESIEGKVPCRCEPCKNARTTGSKDGTKSHYFDYQYLQRKCESGDQKVECRLSLEKFEAIHLLDGIEIESWAESHLLKEVHKDTRHLRKSVRIMDGKLDRMDAKLDDIDWLLEKLNIKADEVMRLAPSTEEEIKRNGELLVRLEGKFKDFEEPLSHLKEIYDTVNLIHAGQVTPEQFTLLDQMILDLQENQGNLPEEVVQALEAAQKNEKIQSRVKFSLTALGPAISFETDAGVTRKGVLNLLNKVREVLKKPEMNSHHRLGD